MLLVLCVGVSHHCHVVIVIVVTTVVGDVVVAVDSVLAVAVVLDGVVDVVA